MTTYKNHYLTTQKDYVPKQIENVKYLGERNKMKNNLYNDPISEAFKNYIYLDPFYKEYPEEELDKYIDKALDKYPGFKDLLQDERIDKNVIRKSKIYDGHSVYQVVYCDIEQEIADKEHRRRNAVTLPNNSDVPLTNQKAGYRNPASINSRAYEKMTIYIPPNNLDPNHKVREILKVTTGDSEYMAVIGKLGEKIEVEELHGHMPKL